MTFFNKFTDTVMGILKYVFLIFILLFIGFLIKWRIDHLHLTIYSEAEASLSLKDEFYQTMAQIKNVKKGNVNSDSVSSIPVVTEEDTMKNVSFSIEKGDSIQAIGRNLTDKKLMNSEKDFVALVDSMGLSNKDKFIPGEYKIKSNATVREIVCLLTATEEKQYVVEFSPNSTPLSVGNTLAKEGIIESPPAFEQEVKAKGYGEKLISGSYEIITPNKVSVLIDKIYKDK